MWLCVFVFCFYIILDLKKKKILSHVSVCVFHDPSIGSETCVVKSQFCRIQSNVFHLGSLWMRQRQDVNLPYPMLGCSPSCLRMRFLLSLLHFFQTLSLHLIRLLKLKCFCRNIFGKKLVFYVDIPTGPIVKAMQALHFCEVSLYT